MQELGRRDSVSVVFGIEWLEVTGTVETGLGLGTESTVLRSVFGGEIENEQTPKVVALTFHVQVEPVESFFVVKDSSKGTADIDKIVPSKGKVVHSLTTCSDGTTIAYIHLDVGKPSPCLESNPPTHWVGRTVEKSVTRM